MKNILALLPEQEGRGKVLVGEDAGCPGAIEAGAVVGEVLREVVAVAVGDEPPEHGEQQPGEHEAGEEGEEGVAPPPVQDRHEHVL